MAQDEAVEILIRARNEASAVLNAAVRDVQRLGAANANAGAVGRAQFREISGAIKTIVPEAGAATAGLESMGVAVAGLGPVAIALTAIGVAAAGIAVAGASAIKFLADMGARAEEIGNLAQKTNLAASSLQALQLAAHEAGVPVESLETGVRFLNRSISDADPLLKKLNITTGDTEQALLQLADVFAAAPDGPDKTAAAIKLLGRGGTELIPILNQGGAALAAFIAQAKESGSVLSDETVAALKKVDDQFDEMERSITRVKNALASTLAPAFLEASKLLESFVNAKLHQLSGALDAVGAALELFGSRLGIASGPAQAFHAAAAQIEASLKRVGDAAKGAPLTPAAQNFAELTGEVEGVRVPLAVLTDQFGSFADGAARIASLSEAMDSLGEKTKDTTLSFHDILVEVNKLPKPEVERKGVVPAGDFDKVVRFQLQAVAEPVLSFSTSFAAISAQFITNLNEMTSAAETTASLMGEAFAGLEAGMSQVFVSLTSRAQTFRSAIQTIFRSMVNSVLAELGRLVAARIFKLFLQLAGIALGGPAGLPNIAIGGALAAPVELPGRRSLSSSGPAASVINRNLSVDLKVSTLDSKSFSDFMRAPMGPGRLAGLEAAASAPI